MAPQPLMGPPPRVSAVVSQRPYSRHTSLGAPQVLPSTPSPCPHAPRHVSPKPSSRVHQPPWVLWSYIMGSYSLPHALMGPQGSLWSLQSHTCACSPLVSPRHPQVPTCHFSPLRSLWSPQVPKGPDVSPWPPQLFPSLTCPHRHGPHMSPQPPCVPTSPKCPHGSPHANPNHSPVPQLGR